MHLHGLLPLLLTTATAVAQTITVPSGTAQTAGASNTTLPWGSQTQGLGLTLGSRQQATYGAANFTGQSVVNPIRITDLRWRFDEAASSQLPLTFGNATVRMSTSPVGWNNVSSSFQNHGPDVTTVYAGSVANLPFAAPWTPQSYIVDLHLSTPFDYDPTAGDLVVDVDLPGSQLMLFTTLLDATGAGSQAQSVNARQNYPFVSSVSIGAPVLEIAYGPATGYAAKTRLGTGCNPGGDMPFYEMFPSGSFDLTNTSLSLLHGGTDYRVERGNIPMQPLTGATILNHGDDTSITVPLNSGSIPFGQQGTATSLTVCSNGFVSVGDNGASSYPNATQHLSAPYTCWRAFWADFDPTASGSGKIWWEETATHVFVTWFHVASFYVPGSSSTFQYQFEKFTGNVHFVYGTMNVGIPGLIGFAEGGNSPDPGPTNLSAAAPFTRTFVGNALALELPTRPVLGTQLAFTTTDLPVTHPLGALLFGASGYPTGLSLAAIGMPGCLQYASADAVHVFVPFGSSVTTPLALPANPAFSGTQIYAQSVLLQPYANPLGAVTSNGFRLTLGTH